MFDVGCAQDGNRLRSLGKRDCRRVGLVGGVLSVAVARLWACRRDRDVEAGSHGCESQLAETFPLDFVVLTP